jgi:signal peptidase I
MAGVKKKYISQEYSAEKGGKNLKEGTGRSRRATIFAACFFSVAVIIGVSLISFTIVFFFSAVKGHSMMKVLNASGNDTDSVLVNRYAVPKRGDIIVVQHFDVNGNFKEYHIKRYVACGGESVHMKLSGDNQRYIIEVDGVEYDNTEGWWVTYGSNQVSEYNKYHANFYNYQQTGDASAMSASARGGNNPGFRTHYTDKTGASVPFRQFVTERNRWEIVLPDDYIFYMGDNRGGPGTSYDFSIMSTDCTYYGPQPYSRIVGVAVEIIHDKGAPQWFWDKIVWLFTFQWV